MLFRSLADTVGINMHTVNKAYTVLKQEGYLTLDRRKGAVISLDADKVRAIMELRRTMQILMAEAMCKGVTRNEVHELVDLIYDEWNQG